MTNLQLPELPYDEWEPTKNTLHLYLQIFGKLRLTLHPHWNHWWHVPHYVDTRGVTTGIIPLSDGRALEMRLAMRDNQAALLTSDGQAVTFDIENGLSVGDFYDHTFAALKRLDVKARIHRRPFDFPSPHLFHQDEEHKSWQPEHVTRYHEILVWIDGVLRRFKGRFIGKDSPIHLFWHSFDLAYTRFSGRRAPEMPDADRVTREAYSHEVISFGFWAGDPENRAPAFYSYTAPEPDGLRETQLQPAEAIWAAKNDSSLGVLPYDAVRESGDPEGTLLQFLQSTYDAGADLAGWDRKELDAPE